MCVCVYVKTCDRISLTQNSVCMARFLRSHTQNTFPAKDDAMPKDKETPFEAQILEKLDKLQMIPGDIKQVKEDIGTILKMNEELKESLDFAHTRLDDHDAALKEKEGEISALEKDLAQATQVNKRLTSKVSHLERSVILQEAYSKRHNIIIEGLPEAQGEDTELRAVHLMADTMKLPISKKDIDKCHRFGRSVNNRPKPIIVRCIMHSTRDKVLQAARKSTHKPEGIFLNDDLPAPIKKERAVLRQTANYATSCGATVRLSGDRLSVNNLSYTYKNLSTLPYDLSLYAARTVKSGDCVGFYSEFSYLSNFSKAMIQVESQSYPSMEHYYQTERCRAAGRDDLVEQIAATSDCVTVKSIGDSSHSREHTQEWFTKQEAVMKKGLVAKFSQHPDLKDKLMHTGNAVLVECTSNKFWGGECKLSSNELRMQTFRGKNKLGKLLMEVRNEMR